MVNKERIIKSKEQKELSAQKSIWFGTQTYESMKSKYYFKFETKPPDNELNIIRT